MSIHYNDSVIETLLGKCKLDELSDWKGNVEKSIGTKEDEKDGPVGAGRVVIDEMFHTRYTIHTQDHELPVIGTFVDEQILPGFYYRVRRIDSDDFLFGGEARLLLNIGMGYGKRITFLGNSTKDNSDFYFYSDTESKGFGFTPTVCDRVRNFNMLDEDGRQTAEVKVISYNSLQSKRELNADNIVVKILVHLNCNVNFGLPLHERLSLSSAVENVSMTGMATMSRDKRSKGSPARLIAISNIQCSPIVTNSTLLPV